MRPDVPYLQAKFDEFNALFFGAQLPPISLELSHAASYIGICTFKTRRKWLGKPEYYDFRIRISTRLDLPEAEVEDTLIHEMIHYWLRLHQIKDTSAHGKEFRRIMDEINTRYGRHITISHRPTKEQREAAMDKRPRWRVVAILRFKDGKEGLKLLPRVKQRVTAYHRAVMRSGEFSGIEYYLSNDPWFNRYPTSSAFNVLFVPMDEVRAHLSSAISVSSSPKDLPYGIL